MSANSGQTMLMIQTPAWDAWKRAIDLPSLQWHENKPRQSRMPLDASLPDHVSQHMQDVGNKYHTYVAQQINSLRNAVEALQNRVNILEVIYVENFFFEGN